MNIRIFTSILCMLTIVVANPALAQSTDITTLRAELQKLRRDYELRISQLEQRLEVAEKKSPAAQASSVAVSPAARSSNSDSAFNPAVGVIFQGQAWSYDNDPGDYAVQRFPFGGEAGPFDEGIAIGEAEIDVSANIDDKFTAWLTVPVVVEEEEKGVTS